MFPYRRCCCALTCLVILLYPIYEATANETLTTIFIKADGSVVPPTPLIMNKANAVYTFTGEIRASIVIERDNIAVDGCGYALQGAGKSSTTVGLDLSNRKNVSVTGLKVTGFCIAFQMWNTSSIRLSRNYITSNRYYGCDVWNSSHLEISCNMLSFNEIGLKIEVSSDNVVYNNTLENNKIGLHFFFSLNNLIYHNYFENNTSAVTLEDAGENSWDNGYPQGGNYWSDYTSTYSNPTDKYSGENQNTLASDGFYDSPYVLDKNNVDRYPIRMESSTFPILIIWLLLIIGIAFASVILGRRRISKYGSRKQKPTQCTN